MKIITLKEHCTAMAPYSLLYNRFHQTHLMLVYVMMPSVDACLYVMTHTNCTASQMVFNFTKKNHYFNLFFSIEKLDFKCQHDKNYCLRGHLTLDLISTYLVFKNLPYVSKMSHRKWNFSIIIIT